MSPGRPFAAANLPLQGLALVEASAGTGKTFNLAGLYLRLIVAAGASVREILVMTFTKAATQELRDRIRRRLVDAARIAADPGAAEGDNPEHRFAREIIAASSEDPGALARRLAEAAAGVDQAAIVTIHGFAQRAAADNAFESALAFDRGEPVDDASVQRAACVDYWRRHVFAADARGELQRLWPSPEALHAELRPILARPHAVLDGIEPDRLETTLARLEKRWPAARGPLTAALEAALAANAIKNSGVKTLLGDYATPAALVADLDNTLTRAFANREPPVLADALAELAEPARFIDQRGKAKQACATAFAAIDALADLAVLVPAARLDNIRAAATAVEALAGQRKRAWRQFSYDDLIVALHAALVHPARGQRLAEALAAQWPFALVDEFQDTDPLQYAILRRIYLDSAAERGALILIGDPKQAIYGFRGGDIHAYLAAARAAGDRRYTLATNHRATQGLLDAVEALYRWPDARPFVETGIDFLRVEPGRAAGDRRLVAGDKTRREQPALTVWQLTGGTGTKDDDRKRLTQQAVAAIAGLLAGGRRWRFANGQTRAVAAGDIAVLVNTGFEAAGVQTALAEHGIMAACQRRDSVFAAGEAGDLLRELRAIARPDDVMRVRAAETTDLAGQRLADLIAIADDDAALQARIAHYQERHEQWRRRGVLAALEGVFVDAAPRVLALADGERRMSNYLQLGELLAQAEPECYGMAGLVHWLETRIASAGDEVDDETQLRLEADTERVRIATVHAAKGLEYPIVFMPFSLWLGAPKPNHRPDKPPLIYHDPQDRHPEQPHIDPIGLSDAAVERALIEARSEALRLFYVAATRAEQALFIAWREPGDGTSRNAGGGARDSALANLLGRDGAFVAAALAELAARHAGTIAVENIDCDVSPPAVARVAPAKPSALGRGRTALPRPRPTWSSWSFSRLAQARSDPFVFDAPVPGAEDEWAMPADSAPVTDTAPVPELDPRLAGVGFGSAVHDILETQAGRGWPRPGAALSPEQRARVAHALRRHGLVGRHDDDPRVEQTATLVARTLHAPLPELGALAAIDAGRLRAEMGFMLRLRGERLGAVVATARAAGYLPEALSAPVGQRLFGLLQGYIDLVVAAGGRYYVLDYKTNRLGDTLADYHGAHLARAITRSHYDLQYLLYTVALHRHLRGCLGPAYDPATHLGGVQYLFVRAMDGETDRGVFVDRPDPALIDALDDVFDADMQTSAAYA